MIRKLKADEESRANVQKFLSMLGGDADEVYFYDHDVLIGFFQNSGEAKGKFLNEVATLLAQQYHAGDLTYYFCDVLINELQSVSLFDELDARNLDRFREVYEAFDGGEFYMKGETGDEPIRKRTDPAIIEFVRKLEAGVSS